MYSQITELPSQVTSSLKGPDAEAWMKAYNEAVGDADSIDRVMDARRRAWYSVRERPSSYSFCAKASVETVDKQNELVTLESIRKHMDDYIKNGGPMSWDHSSYIIGTIWGWDEVDTPKGPGIQVWGNLFGGDDYIYDQTRKRFSKGATKLSVAGPADKERVCDSEHGCYIRRNLAQLMEIALTPHPVNEYATLVWNNSSFGDVAKSDRGGAVLSLYDIDIHRSEDACPIMQLRKSLRDIGADAHARRNGVFIPMEDPMGSIAKARDVGLYALPGLDDKLGYGMFVREPSALLEEEFRKSFSAGECDTRGRFTGMDESRFKELVGKGVAVKHSDGWGFRTPI